MPDRERQPANSIVPLPSPERRQPLNSPARLLK